MTHVLPLPFLSTFPALLVKLPGGRRRSFTWAGPLLLALLFAPLSGCGDGSATHRGVSQESTEVTGFDDARPGSRARVIHLENASYFHTADRAAESGLCGGLHRWADLDGDGWDDLIIAYRRSGGVNANLGWLEAWSPSRGERLWQVTGMPSRPSEDKKRLIAGYGIGEIAKIDDVDGDHVADIFSRRRLKGTILIYSGKTGQLIERRYEKQTRTFVTPVRTQDVDGDGAADLWFVAVRPSRFVIRSALGGKHIRDIPLWWDGIEGEQNVKVAIPRFTDVNGDGVTEVLLYRMLPNPGGRIEQLEMAVLSGSDLRLLHKFATAAPRMFGETSFAAPGDLTGDGTPDIVRAMACGAGPEGRVSHLLLIDGSSGNIVWAVTGDQPGGVQQYSLDMVTGEKTALPPDIEYGGSVLILPDLNDDGAADLGTVCQTRGGAAGALFVHSGRDGRLLGTVAPDGDAVRLSDRKKTQSVLLTNTKSGAPEVVLTGRDKKGQAALVVLPLPGRS